MMKLLFYTLLTLAWTSQSYGFEGKYYRICGNGKKCEHSEIEITKDKGKYYFYGIDIRAVKPHNLLVIDKEEMTQLNAGTYKIKECNLTLVLLLDKVIRVSHDDSCRGMGTTIEGDWHLNTNSN